jgi:hypothetical protein
MSDESPTELTKATQQISGETQISAQVLVTPEPTL